MKKRLTTEEAIKVWIQFFGEEEWYKFSPEKRTELVDRYKRIMKEKEEKKSKN